MSSTAITARRTCLWLAVFLVPVLMAAPTAPIGPRQAVAQQAGPQADDPGPSDAEAAPAEAAGETTDAEAPEAEGQGAEAGEVLEEINILELLIKGGYLMLPILAMSLLVVTFGAERLLGLRRIKVIPRELVDGLGKLAGQKGGLEPRPAYKLCQQYPSAAASVIKAMLLKVGRPHSELEHAVAEANDREAARLYSNVRWLSLAAGVTPLLGLLGTVWGMIQAFFATANLPTGANKAEHLANGIYVALVTTFAGLAVAIPAAVLAHTFEGRIQTLFRELDETLMGLMPQLERFEGRLRVSKDTATGLAVGGGGSPEAASAGKSQQRAAAAAPKAAAPK